MTPTKPKHPERVPQNFALDVQDIYYLTNRVETERI